jgi:hypothetical protein
MIFLKKRWTLPQIFIKIIYTLRLTRYHDENEFT